MKKLIGVLGLVSLFIVGMANDASAQFGGGGYQGDGRQVSSRAKGAIIGGGLGAAAGAVVNRRDPVSGAVVGAVLGAGAGYVIGNSEDRRRAEQYQYRNSYPQQRGGGYYRKGYRNRGGYYSNNNYRYNNYYRGHGRSCR